jgi:hypothetical protein
MFLCCGGANYLCGGAKFLAVLGNRRRSARSALLLNFRIALAALPPKISMIAAFLVKSMIKEVKHHRSTKAP